MQSLAVASPRLRQSSLGETLAIVAAWGLVATILVLQYVPALIANGPIDPDSQMRLVEVRDYLAGQAWTDLHQARLNPPDGVILHWSRLIDWPLSVLIRIGQPLLGREKAEVLALTAWPLMLYLVYFFGFTAVVRRLVGPAALLPALAFAAFAAPATGMFIPGHITHHNAQIALFSLLLALAVRIDRGETIGVFAGIVAAVSLSIGLETLPLVTVVGAALALTWVFAPASSRAALNGFGLFFAVGMVAQRGFAASPADWLASPCDIASLPYVIAALVGGFGLAGLAKFNPSTLALRFAGLAGLGLAAAIAVALVNPHCLKGPYAEIDPRLIPLWLDHVDEAQSFGQIATRAPWTLIGLYLAPFLALIPTSWAFAMAGRQERAGWGLVLLALMTALAVAMWEARGSTFASVLVVPGMAYAVTEVRRKVQNRGPVVLALGLILVYTLPNQALETIVAGVMRQRLSPRPTEVSAPIDAAAPTGFALCAARETFAGLAVQPAGTVLSESNLGPSILLDTPHSVLAAPYHRNTTGLIDGLTALGSDFAVAHDIIARRHVAYVATCPADPEVDLIRQTAPNGLLARLLAGDVPDWLAPVANSGPLKLWRVIDPSRAELPDMIATGAVKPSQPLPVAIPDLRGSLPPAPRG